MMFKFTTVALLAATMAAMVSSNSVLANNNNNNDAEYSTRRRSLKSSKSSSSSSSDEAMITLTNISFKQPFGGIFVMVHDDDVAPLFRLGQPSSAALGTLAETGSPADLVSMYSGMSGVASAVAVPGPVGPGMSINIPVEMTGSARYVTIATMAINTNDCFVALNGVKVQPGDSIRGVGYDSGTEVNNQNCNSIPGPACTGGNVADGNGEGFVHVHRGVQTGVGDLPMPQDLDWRNPMVMFSVSRV